MKVTQVFSEYGFDNKHSGNLFIYCPMCRTKCTEKTEGGQLRPVCPRCGFVQYKNPSPAVSVLIVNHKQVLLGQRAANAFKGGLWCLPGGFIEFDEDFLTAARREVREETGLVVSIRGILSVITNFLLPDLHTLVIVLLAEVTGGELCPGDDIAAVSWFPLAGPLPEMAFSADKGIIEHYAATGFTGAPVERSMPPQVKRDNG